VPNNPIDPDLSAGLQRALDPIVPGPAAETRILRAVRMDPLEASPLARPFHILSRPLRALLIGGLTAALVAGSIFFVAEGLRARKSQAPAQSPPGSSASAAITPTASIPTPAPTFTAAQWIEKLVPVGGVGAIALGSETAYVITDGHQSPGSYSPALAHIVSINLQSGATRDGGAFPGAASLALAGDALWVASGSGPGISAPEANQLYRLNASTLAVEEQASIASLSTSDNHEPPVLVASGDLLWIGYSTHVARLNETTGAIIIAKTVGDPGAAVSSLSIDPNATRLYAGFASAGPSIAELDATSGAIIAVSTAAYGDDLGGPKLAAFVGNVWVAYPTGTAGSVVDLSATNLNPIAGGAGGIYSNSVAVFTGHGLLWLSDGMANQLICADPVTGAPRATVNWPAGGLIAADTAQTLVGGGSGVYFLHPVPSCSTG
jgi:hypothetical protein